MRFKTLDKVYDAYGSRMNKECFDNLVRDFDIVKGVWQPGPLSEMERTLIRGRSTTRNGDFNIVHDEMVEEPTYIQLDGVIDHAYMFKCRSGNAFILTLPYNTPEGFMREFGKLKKSYGKAKSDIMESLVDHDHDTPNWKKQLETDANIEAAVLDMRYMIRNNGSMVAMIATESTLQDLGAC